MEHDPTSRIITASPPQPKENILESRSWARPAGTALLSVWIIFSNLFIIIALLTSEKRRRISFNLHVINLSLVGLITGCIVLPFNIDHDLSGFWDHSDVVCRLWIISDLLVCTVSVLIVGMMVFDRFVMFACTSVAEGSGKFVFAAFVILTPWILGCAFVIPVYLQGEIGNSVNSFEGTCYLNMEKNYAILLLIVGYFVPGLAGFGILVAATLTLFIRKDNLNEMDWVGEIEDKGWQILMSWLMHIFVLGMWLPFSILALILFVSGSNWPPYLEVSVWIAYANPGVTPLLWMAMPRVRKSVTRLFCCCCKPKTPRRQLNFRTDYSFDDDSNISMLEYRLKNSKVSHV